jgi:esterase
MTDPDDVSRVDLGPVSLAWREDGLGVEPVLCIHGSWDDHRSWDGFVQALGGGVRVVRYDRRGHSASTAPPGQGRLREDVEDVAGLLDALGIDAAHVIGHSYGATIAIMLAARFPARVRSLMLHEPPVFALLAGDSQAEALRAEASDLMKQAADLLTRGETEPGARLFIERVAFGAGAWDTLFGGAARAAILNNAQTWLDQFHDPERLSVDVRALADFHGAITMSTGTSTLPAYAEVVKRIAALLPAMRVSPVDGGHGAHISHPRCFADAFRRHMRGAIPQG